MAKSKVRLDKLKSVYNDSSIHSVRSTNVLENGFVGHIGDIEAGNRDINALVTPSATTADQPIVLVANPALVYDNNRLGSGLESNYEMPAGEAVRAYEVTKNDVFSVSREGLVLLGAAAVEDNYVVTGTGNKLVEISATDFAALTEKPAFVGKIAREDAVGGALAINVSQTPTTYVVIQVISN